MAGLKNIIRSLLIPSICILILFTCLQAQHKKTKNPDWNWQKHQTEIINYAKKYSVSNIEKNLPRQQFAVWFQKLVGSQVKAGWDINDCGEQTGTDEDRRRDFPMCVETSAKISDAIFLRVNIQYGTFKRGITGGKPVVRSIFLGGEAGDGGADYEKLSELPEELKKIKKALVFFDPNDGVFYISGDKPAGFEDFSEMWISTTDDNLKGERFPLKKTGGVGFGQKDYKLRTTFFDGKNWSFETVAVDGVRFSFKGKFAKPRLDSHGAALDDNVLQGQLIKFVGGKIAAQAALVFRFALQGE